MIYQGVKEDYYYSLDLHTSIYPTSMFKSWLTAWSLCWLVIDVNKLFCVDVNTIDVPTMKYHSFIGTKEFKMYFSFSGRPSFQKVVF